MNILAVAVIVVLAYATWWIGRERGRAESGAAALAVLQSARTEGVINPDQYHVLLTATEIVLDQVRE